jgi:hypothetical protein
MANKNAQVIDRAVEIFGQLLGQEFAINSLTPRDTNRMATSFQATEQVIQGDKGKVIRFTTPYYTKFVNDGTKNIRARKFIQKIIHQKGEELLKKAFRIASKQV